MFVLLLQKYLSQLKRRIYVLLGAIKDVAWNGLCLNILKVYCLI